MKLTLVGEINDIGTKNLTIRDLAFSPDDKLLVSGGTDGIIRFWQPATRTEIAQIDLLVTIPPVRIDIQSLAFNPDGSLLAVAGSDGFLVLFNAANLELFAKFPLQKRVQLGEHCVVFSPCGQYIAVVGWNNSFRIIDMIKQIVIQQIKFQGWMDSVTFHPTKKILAIAGSKAARLLNFEAVGGYANAPKKLALDINKLVSEQVAFSSNGEWLAIPCYDDTLRVYHIDEQKPLSEKSPRFICRGHHGGTTTVAWQPQKELFISGSGDGSIYLWNGVNGELLDVNKAHNKQISALCWQNDGEMFASTSFDRSIKFWKVD